MTLKGASLLALVGMLLVTLVALADLVNDVLAVARGVLPAVVLLRSLVYTFASFSLLTFLYVFHKGHSGSSG